MCINENSVNQDYFSVIPSGRWSRRVKERRRPDAPLHRLQRPLPAGQKSCFCHFRSSILIPLTRAQWAPGSPGKGRNLGDEFIYLGTWSVRWGRRLSRPPLPPRLFSITENRPTCTEKSTYAHSYTWNTHANLPPLAVLTHSLLINQVFWNLSSVSCWMLFVVLLQHPTKTQPVGQYSKGHAPPRQSPAAAEHQHI